MINEYKHIADRAEFARAIRKAGTMTVSFRTDDSNCEGEYASCIFQLSPKVAVADVMRGAYDGFWWDVDMVDGTAWLRRRHAPIDVRLARRIDLLERRNARAAKSVEGYDHTAWAQNVRTCIAAHEAEIRLLRARAAVIAA